MYRRERSAREETFMQRRKTKTPSFSSSLLDAIYNSISEEGEENKAAMFKKQNGSCIKREVEDDVSSLRRAIMIEKWVEKQSISHGSMHVSSNSSSSESSSGCMFSSSEENSNYREKSRKFSSFTKQRQTPVASQNHKQFEQRNRDNQQQQKQENRFTKTKLRALKIYGELKKVKQPISPGGRISSFLNSIFNSTNAKKAKMCYVGAAEDVSLESKSKSTCSSASSFSRSCLNKSSRGKVSNNGTKRSVRFYPVSVIVDEDCRPCGHKCIYEDDPSLMATPSVQNLVKSCSLKDGFKNFVVERESYQKKNGGEFDLRGFLNNGDDEDEDDADSYASSDLFELDSLIGIGKYREELPVYETTNLKTNQAIANGLLL